MTDEPATPDPLIGHVFANSYAIVEEIGRGAMGVVYRAHSEILSQDFAVKVLSPELAEDEHVRHRFLQEAKALTALSHQHIVPVRHCGEEEGRLFVVMGLCGGETLGAIIDREAPLSEERATHIAMQVAGALGAAHAAGIVHRDLKPENVMIEQRTGADGAAADHVSVLDFGLAHVVETATSKLPGAQATIDGDVVGTVAYMSPEQIRAASDVDGRSDLFSLGVVLHEMLAGRRPFESDAVLSVMMRILETPAPQLPEEGPAGISRQLRSVVTRALMKEREDRFQSADDLLAALRGDLDPKDAERGTRPVPKPEFRSRRRWIVAAALLIAIAAAIVLLASGGEDHRGAAKEAFAACKHFETIRHLEAAAAEGELTGEEQLMLAQSRTVERDTEAASNLAEAARILGPGDARVSTARGYYFWRVAKEPKKALDAFAAAVVEDGDSIDGLCGRLEMYFAEPAVTWFDEAKIDRGIRATQDLDAIRGRAPDDPRVALFAGLLELYRKSVRKSDDTALPIVEAAIKHFGDAARAEPTWAEPEWRLAQALNIVAQLDRIAGRYDSMHANRAKALQAMDSAIALMEANPTHRCQVMLRPTLYQGRSFMRIAAGDHQGAIADIRTVHQNAGDLRDYLDMAEGLRMSGQIDEAIALYQRLIQATQDSMAYYNLGYCYERKALHAHREGRRADARELLDKAIEAFTASLPGSAHRGVVLAYRAEAHLRRSDATPGGSKDDLVHAGADFVAAAAQWGPDPARLELTFRYSEYQCRMREFADARRLMAETIADDPNLNAAGYGRYAQILMCAAADALERGDRGAFTDAVVEAKKQLGEVRGIQRTHTLGVHVLTGDLALLHAYGTDDAETREREIARAREALAEAQGQVASEPAYITRRVLLAVSEAALEPGPGRDAVAKARLAALASGRFRLNAAFYRVLANSLRTAGLDATAAEADTMAAHLE